MEGKLFTELTLSEQENLSGGLLDTQLGLNIAAPIQTATAVNALNFGGSSSATAKNTSDIKQSNRNSINRFFTLF